ncbi:lysophospholipid acyltransferase family protein [Nocardioides montaniterrae]
MKHPPRWLLHGGRPASRRLVRLRYDVRLHHAERFPSTGPVIVAANHIGIIDGPLMAIFSPRPVHALTKLEMFQGRAGGFLRLAGQVPLDRGRTDPAAIRASLHVLDHGGAVGVFPEGTRGDGELTTFRPGAAYLAMVSGAPVVPLTFLGTREAGGPAGSLPPRGARIEMVFGRPFRVAAHTWPRTKAQVAAINADLRDHMREDLWRAVSETGRSLPGPLPVDASKRDRDD